MKIISVLLVFVITACNFFGPTRLPSGEVAEQYSKRQKLSFQLAFSDIKTGFEEAVKTSPIIESINRFYMDPVSRIFSVNLTVNYPLDKLLDFTALPENARISDKHDIEISFRFSKTKDLVISNYLGLELTKFDIDNRDYLGEFDIVLSVVQTILANSELTDYLLVKNRDQLPSEDTVNLVKEIFDSKTIRVFPETKKIKLNLDLAKFAELNHLVKKVKNLKLWRFSPSIYETETNTEGVSFLIVVGEGKPHEEWIEKQQEVIKDDTRTLLQVREDQYREYSNIENALSTTDLYLKKLLKQEGITIKDLRLNYQADIQELLKNLKSKAQKNLSRGNDHFIASPEYEFLQFSKYSENTIQNFVAELDRKLSIDEYTLKGGDSVTDKKPLVTLSISETLLNKGINYVVDTEVEGHQMFKDLNIWLMPQKNGLMLKGDLNLPIKYILGNIDKDLLGGDYKSHIMETKSGFPFELTLLLRMGDNGKLGIDIDRLEITANKKKIRYTRNDKNQRFLIDLVKVYLAKTLASLDLDLAQADTTEEAKKLEINKIFEYLKIVKSAFGKDGNSIQEMMLSDLKINPFNSTGSEYLEKKKNILFKDFISFNSLNQLFEVHVNPALIIDKISNVEHNLQVWGVTPLKSKQLNNTFLEVSVGEGLRTNDFINGTYRRAGVAENALYSGVYYDLSRDESSVDMLYSLNFKYLKGYVNKFLSQISNINKTDIGKQATDEPGKMFFEVHSLNFDITTEEKFKLNVVFESAEYGRNWSSWFTKVVSKVKYSVTVDLDMKAKAIDNTSTSLLDLKYYPQSISVTPSNYIIDFGTPTLIHRAMKFLIGKALNNGSIKRLIMKMLNKSLNKMYLEKKGKLLGHEMERYARIKATANDILVYINPKLAGAAFDLHLAGDEKADKKAIKFDPDNQIMHFALTAGTGMTKTDKKEMILMYQDTLKILKPFEEATSKEEIVKILKGQSFAQKLVHDTTKGKRGIFNRYKRLLNKYEQILHFTSIDDAVVWDTTRANVDMGALDRNYQRAESAKVVDITSAALRTRLSTAGAELLYFAGFSTFLQKKLSEVADKMTQFELNKKGTGFIYIKNARDIIDQNINKNFLKAYEYHNHKNNRIVLDNPISYWTYQVYPDAFFAEEIYKLIKNGSK